MRSAACWSLSQIGKDQAINYQQQPLPEEIIATIVEQINANEPSPWLVWLFGNLPRDQVASRIAALQTTAPQIHYAVSLLWAFRESWISRHWEVYPSQKF